MALAEAGSEQDVLLDDALFEDGFFGAGLFVADLDSLAFHLGCEVVGFGFFGEFVGVLAEAVLLDEVGVLQLGDEARGVWDGLDLCATDIALDQGPALGGLFAAALLPSAEIESAPSGGKAKDIFEGQDPKTRMAGPFGPVVGEVWGHDS